MKPIHFLLVASLACMVHDEPPSRSDPLRVMTFNILQGGEDASNVGFNNALFGGSRFDELAAVVRLAKADVVGVQEDCGSDKFLKALGDGWQRLGSVYSRLPMQQVKVASYLTVVRLTLTAGRTVTLVNCHWSPPAKCYGPDLAQQALKDDPKLADLTAVTKRIVDACAVPNGARGYKATLEPLRVAIDAKESVILTGDFNESSHLDWTDAYAKSGADRWVKNPTGTPLRFAVPWPGSKALEAIGMKDSFRSIHADEVQKPGPTWTPEYPARTPGRRSFGDQCLDRIDRIYHSGAGLSATTAEVVGEVKAFADLVCSGRWPSDHRAVVVSFTWK